jgi:dTDP-4-amino-4,6-dideoxygalactose transaminase
MDIAVRHGLAVVEDCAHVHGQMWSGQGIDHLVEALAKVQRHAAELPAAT